MLFDEFADALSPIGVLKSPDLASLAMFGDYRQIM